MTTIVFRAVDAALAQAVAAAFSDVDLVEASTGDIFDAGAADAIVSPANSHGWMDGGIDLAYVRRWGWHLQDANIRLCRLQPEGALPVGRAVTLATGAGDVPWVIAAPTMSLPQPVPNSQNAYHAFKAALVVCLERGFRRVLCPGLGTGTGRIPYAESARQMRRAWDEVMGA